MKTYEVEVVQNVSLRVKLQARDAEAARRGAEAYASYNSGVAVKVEGLDVISEDVEVRFCEEAE